MPSSRAICFIVEKTAPPPTTGNSTLGPPLSPLLLLLAYPRREAAGASLTTQIGFVAVPVAIDARDGGGAEVHVGVFFSVVESVGDDLLSVSVREEVYRPRRDDVDEGGLNNARGVQVA